MNGLRRAILVLAVVVPVCVGMLAGAWRLHEARPGSIVLLHVEIASRAEGRAASPRIISGLRARGLELVTVSDLIERGTSGGPAP